MHSFITFQRVAIIMFILLNVWIVPVSAMIFAEDGSNLTVEDLNMMTNTTKPAHNTEPVTFFYDQECGPCIPVHDYLVNYLSEHPDIEVEMVNLSSGSESERRMGEMYIQHNRTLMNTPVIFFGPVGLEGTDEIINAFESVYHWYKDEDCDCSKNSLNADEPYVNYIHTEV